jgi:hypothetical protein
MVLTSVVLAAMAVIRPATGFGGGLIGAGPIAVQDIEFNGIEAESSVRPSSGSKYKLRRRRAVLANLGTPVGCKLGNRRVVC